MFDQGLLDEVKDLHERGYTKDMTSMKGIGYKEVLDYLKMLKTLSSSHQGGMQKDRLPGSRGIHMPYGLTWMRSNLLMTR